MTFVIEPISNKVDGPAFAYATSTSSLARLTATVALGVRRALNAPCSESTSVVTRFTLGLRSFRASWGRELSQPKLPGGIGPMRLARTNA